VGCSRTPEKVYKYLQRNNQLKVNGFSGHILEAIFINLKRLPLYALKTIGLSIPISLGLIAFEIAILPLAVYFDLTGRKWRVLGIPDMTDDFISMGEIPPFKFKTTQIPGGLLPLPAIAKTQLKILNHLLNGELKYASKEMIKATHKLGPLETTSFPLVLHFIESSARANNLTLLWLKKYQRELGRNRLESHYVMRRKWFVIWQLMGLQGALILDILSFPLRKIGVPLLVNDVPKIPVPALPE